jgi:Xaa-Pro dipeptidase
VVQAASVIEDAGFTTVDDLVHGLGGGYLPPVFDSRSRTLEPLPELRFAEGMTVVVQPNVTTPDRRAGVQTGELLLITAAGCERPAPVPRGLVRIAETRPAIGNVRERRLEEE